MKKTMWLLIGLACLLLGLLGVILPLLPTTPFLLLSAFSFAHSSPKLHDWLMNHRRWGQLIKNWHDGGRIDRQSKTIAVGFMLLMPIISYLMHAPMWAIGLQLFILFVVATFILSRPS